MMRRLLFLPLLLSCVGPSSRLTPIAEREQAAALLTVTDFMDVPWPIDAVPLRPRFAVVVPARPPNSRLLLFRGPLDDQQVIAGVSRRALPNALESRLIASETNQVGETLLLTPVSDLDSGGEYVLALASTVDQDASVGRPFSAQTWIVRVANEHAGANLVGVWPPDASENIPLLFDGALVGFSDAVDFEHANVSLQSQHGNVVASISTADCRYFEGRARFCVRVSPPGRLLPNLEHRLLLSGFVDKTGRTLPPFAVRLRTGSNILSELRFGNLECEADEVRAASGCLLVQDDRVRLRSRPQTSVAASLLLAEDARRVHRLSINGEIELTLTNLQAEHEYAGEFLVQTLDGNTSRETMTWRTSSPRPAVRISEVCANPSGPEPAQEYVEVVNVGETPIEIGGWTLSDDANLTGDVLPQATLPAGGRLLVVSQAFETSTSALPAGVSLLRVDASLARGGLTNSGEPLYLRDGVGLRVSSTPALRTNEGDCIVLADPNAETYSVGLCTPGSANTL